MSDRSTVYTQRLDSGDWIFAAHLTGEELRFGAYSLEELTAEIASQLTWKFRGHGRAAIVTEATLPSGRDAELVPLSYAKAEALRRTGHSVRVEAPDASLLLVRRLPEFT